MSQAKIAQAAWNDGGWCRLSRTQHLATDVGVMKRAKRRCSARLIAAKEEHAQRSVQGSAWACREAASAVTTLSRGSLVVEVCWDWVGYCDHLWRCEQEVRGTLGRVQVEACYPTRNGLLATWTFEVFVQAGAPLCLPRGRPWLKGQS